MSYPVSKFGEIRKEIKDLEDEIVSLPFIVDNFIGKDGGEVSGDIDMTGNAIKNLPYPVHPDDAVTRRYLNSLPDLKTAFHFANGAFEAKGKLNLKGFNIENVANPVNNEDVSTKIYTDTTVKRGLAVASLRYFNLYTQSKSFLLKFFNIYENEITKNDFIKRFLKDKEDINPFFNSLLSDATPTPLTNLEVEDINDIKDLIKKVFLEDFYNTLIKKYDSLDDVTKNNNNEVKQIIEKEFLKYKIEKNILDPSFIKLNGHFLAAGEVDMDQNGIKNLPNPVDGGDAVPKSYVDNLPAANTPFNVVGGEFEAKQKLNLKGFNIENIARPINDEDATNKIYVDTLTENRRRQLEANNPFNLESGNFVAKNKINMKGNKIEGVGFPDLPEDVATVAYVDEANVWERKNGGFVAKDHIYLGRKKLGGLKEPQAAGEATNKGYVDKLNEELKDYIEEKTEEIKASVVVDPNNPGNVDAAALDALKTQLEKNHPFNTRNQKTFNARGNLNMRQKTIKNLPEPTDENEVSTKGYTDEKHEELKDYIDDLQFFEKENGYIKSKQTILMDGKTIEQLGQPNFLTDAANKEYVDKNFLNIPFTKVNGHFIASNGLDMGIKKITNLPLPIDEQDAVNKEYVDEEVKKLNEEDRERKAETDRIRVLINEKIKEIEKKEEEFKKYKEEQKERIKLLREGLVDTQTDVFNRENSLREELNEKHNNLKQRILPNERIFKFLGTSIMLIRGEAKGPIIGMDEIRKSNNRRPSPDTPGGFVSLDDKGNIIQPTIVYFGKFDGGEDIKYPRFVIPAVFKINKYGLFFEGEKSEQFNIVVETDLKNFKTDKIDHSERFFSTPLIENNKMHCDEIENPPWSRSVEDCNTLFLYFDVSHPTVTRFFITFVCVLHIPDIKNTWLPSNVLSILNF